MGPSPRTLRSSTPRAERPAWRSPVSPSPSPSVSRRARARARPLSPAIRSAIGWRRSSTPRTSPACTRPADGHASRRRRAVTAEPDLLSLFREEADGRLSSLSDLLLQLESDGPSPDLIHSMFREAHTIKGSAAVAGLENIAREAHVLEELLDRIRSGQWEITPDVVDT